MNAKNPKSKRLLLVIEFLSKGCEAGNTYGVQTKNIVVLNPRAPYALASVPVAWAPPAWGLVTAKLLSSLLSSPRVGG